MMERTFQASERRGARTIICAIRAADCRVTVSYVCHHCGLPLCDGPNCHVKEADHAFAGMPLAIHCPDCRHTGAGVEESLDTLQDLWAILARFLRLDTSRRIR